jgi:hypothetical protein
MSNIKDNSYFIREYETLENKVLKINQIEIGDVGCIVWDAAIVLAKYLEKQIINKNIVVNNNSKQTFLELGAGTGIISIILATYGWVINLIKF